MYRTLYIYILDYHVNTWMSPTYYTSYETNPKWKIWTKNSFPDVDNFNTESSFNTLACNTKFSVFLGAFHNRPKNVNFLVMEGLKDVLIFYDISKKRTELRRWVCAYILKFLRDGLIKWEIRCLVKEHFFPTVVE